MGRRQFREQEVLEVLIAQGAIIPCFRCRVAFTLEDLKTGNIQKEHKHELRLGGPDEPGNCAYSHTSAPCHHTVTNGTPATTAGSSKHRIAKATQPKRIEKFQVNKAPLDEQPDQDPLVRCRRCGEYPDACQCQSPARRQPARAA